MLRLLAVHRISPENACASACAGRGFEAQAQVRAGACPRDAHPPLKESFIPHRFPGTSAIHACALYIGEVTSEVGEEGCVGTCARITTASRRRRGRKGARARVLQAYVRRSMHWVHEISKEGREYKIMFRSNIPMEHPYLCVEVNKMYFYVKENNTI